MKVIQVRGFTYALEAARSRKKWQLDAAMAHLADVQRQVSQADGALAALRERLQEEALHVSQMWTRRPDTRTQERALDFLAALRDQEERLLGELANLRRTLAAARVDCCEKQARVEALDAHRADALRDFLAQQGRKTAVDADQEWSARAARRQTGNMKHV